MNIYKSKAAMTILYKTWDNWIETKGKEIKIGDGSKTFHYIMGTWYDKNDDETGGGKIDDIGGYEDNDGFSDLKSKYCFHKRADINDYDDSSDQESDSIIAQGGKTAAGISVSRAKNNSKGGGKGTTAAGRSAKTGSKKGGKTSGFPNSDYSSESDSFSAQVEETAAGISGGGSEKTGSKKGGKMTAGISDGSAKTGSIKRGGKTTAAISGGSQDAKTDGSKRGGKISDSPSSRTRKRLYQALEEAGEAGKAGKKK